MMFASDLDGTLIYSKRFLDENQKNQPIQSVEIYNRREITFMTVKAIELLAKLSKKMRFVPVTTRTAEQYKRISLFREKIRPTYAIVSNGGVVLKNDEVDVDWQHHMQTKIDRSVVTVDDVMQMIEATSDASWLKEIRKVDPFFIYLIIHPMSTPSALLQQYSEWADEHDWTFSVQGRKVYFVPSFVNKWDAVNYVARREGIETVYAAGDSLLDVCLVEQATFGLIPKHGEAATDFSHLGLTQKEGLLAGEEILETIGAMQSEQTFNAR